MILIEEAWMGNGFSSIFLFLSPIYLFVIKRMNRITCLNLPIASKWLYVGTDKGNVHVVNIDSFALSGYIINWNKAIEVYVNESFHFSFRFYAVPSFRKIT